jgi:predicted O-methyltransferase YrrM
MNDLFSLKRVKGWVRELAELWSGRRSPGLFVAVSTQNGVRYVPLPDRIWATKSHEFWVLLGALLHRLKPESILEFGSGRSSIYLSEYASKQKKCYVSIDNNEKWAMVHRLIARYGSIENDFFHFISLDSKGYYDENEVRKVISKPPDFVFLDGPNQDRSGLMQHKYTLGLCEQADVIIIDDLQWRSVFDQMEIFRSRGKMRTGTIISYDGPHQTQYLCVLVRNDLQPVVDELLRTLQIEPVKSYTREQCVSD